MCASPSMPSLPPVVAFAAEHLRHLPWAPAAPAPGGPQIPTTEVATATLPSGPCALRIAIHLPDVHVRTAALLLAAGPEAGSVFCFPFLGSPFSAGKPCCCGRAAMRYTCLGDDPPRHHSPCGTSPDRKVSGASTGTLTQDSLRGLPDFLDNAAAAPEPPRVMTRRIAALIDRHGTSSAPHCPVGFPCPPADPFAPDEIRARIAPGGLGLGNSGRTRHEGALDFVTRRQPLLYLDAEQRAALGVEDGEAFCTADVPDCSTPALNGFARGGAMGLWLVHQVGDGCVVTVMAATCLSDPAAHPPVVNAELFARRFQVLATTVQGETFHGSVPRSATAVVEDVMVQAMVRGTAQRLGFTKEQEATPAPPSAITFSDEDDARMPNPLLASPDSSVSRGSEDAPIATSDGCGCVVQ